MFEGKKPYRTKSHAEGGGEHGFTKKELEGISGAPLLDEEERVCGIVVRTRHTDHSIAVFPIQELLVLMRREILIQSLPSQESVQTADSQGCDDIAK